MHKSFITYKVILSLKQSGLIYVIGEVTNKIFLLTISNANCETVNYM